ncbi:hypothetical protein LO762_28760 [Actinocorallia sp. API 0066]|uniref:hypothetical protein n=1 Tax=Actinocorallia sp. API 0066 TaxID=2896846 RepID=UPI001E61F766|nr:hypothetical protein [Actinocorallia sp. API 0066]MCD0453141.1 hypothetical protein [Actinocorallia sp. API 0066]
MADENDDLAAVYCLAESRGAEFNEAAVALGAAYPDPTRPGGMSLTVAGTAPVSAAELREHDPGKFKRICGAVMRANAESPSPKEKEGLLKDPFVLGVTSVLLSSVSAVVTTLGIQSLERRRARRDRLPDVIDAFYAAANSYLDRWADMVSNSADYAAVERARADLVATLSRRPTWRARLARRLGLPSARSRLDAAVRSLPLGEPLPSGPGRNDRQTRASQERDRLRESRRAVEGTALGGPAAPAPAADQEG